MRYEFEIGPHQIVVESGERPLTGIEQEYLRSYCSRQTAEIVARLDRHMMYGETLHMAGMPATIR